MGFGCLCELPNWLMGLAGFCVFFVGFGWFLVARVGLWPKLWWLFHRFWVRW